MEKNITRKDIALEAGVSVSVVSRALNNSGMWIKKKRRKSSKLPTGKGTCPIP